jgi:hypothetical protein
VKRASKRKPSEPAKKLRRTSSARLPASGETNRLASAGDTRNDVYARVRAVLDEARSQAWRAVNAAMVAAYWEIGRVIVEEEQQGAQRAGYGQELLKDLSRRLTADFGRGFDRSNLQFMRVFYLLFPNCDALRRELSWTHYRILLKVEKPDARSFYEQEAVAARWSTRELERQVDSLLFERLALSRDKAGLLELAAKGHEICQPTDLVKDPYVLEFTGLADLPRLRESDLEQSILGADADVRELLPARVDGRRREPATGDRPLHRQKRGGRTVHVARGESADICITLQAVPANRGGVGRRGATRAAEH